MNDYQNEVMKRAIDIGYTNIDDYIIGGYESEEGRNKYEEVYLRFEPRTEMLLERDVASSICRMEWNSEERRWDKNDSYDYSISYLDTFLEKFGSSGIKTEMIRDKSLVRTYYNNKEDFRYYYTKLSYIIGKLKADFPYTQLNIYLEACRVPFDTEKLLNVIKSGNGFDDLFQKGNIKSGSDSKLVYNKNNILNEPKLDFDSKDDDVYIEKGDKVNFYPVKGTNYKKPYEVEGRLGDAYILTDKDNMEVVDRLDITLR